MKKDMKQTVEEAARDAIHAHINATVNIHAENVTIANIVMVIIQHSIVANVAQMSLKKDLFLVQNGSRSNHLG